MTTAAALLSMLAGAAAAKDYIVTASRPNMLVVIDAQARKVVNAYPLPGSVKNHGPFAISVSPDGQIAYVLHNRWETVSGIALDTGKEIFRAELTKGNIRAKTLGGFGLSPDGRALAVYVTRTEILPGEYRVLKPAIQIYDTGKGIGAEPVRVLPAPRRVTNVMWATSGKSIYAMGRDMYKLDPRTGAIRGSHPLTNWRRPNFGQPDVFNIAPQDEQTNVFATPYYVSRTNVKQDSPEAMKAGLWTLDLATDKVRYREFENASVGLLSSVVNPARRDEVFTVFNHLTRTDMRTGKVDRVELEHTSYTVNISSDGGEVYVGGAKGDVTVYDSRTLNKLGVIPMPGQADQAWAALRVVKR